MLLSNGFAEVSGVCRWSSPSPPPLGRWRVLPTHQKAHGLNRLVELPLALSSTFRTNPPWFRTISPFPTAERLSLSGAWFSRASREGSHPATARLADAVFVFVCLLYWVFLLFSSPPVYPCFCVYLALWHPCLEPKGPHIQKHCPRVLIFLV
jgi:hypothetical protein